MPKATIEYVNGGVYVDSILDGWTIREVESLLAGNVIALNELARECARGFDPVDVDITLDRAEMERYLADRRAEAARSGETQ